jgi:hypothetical protein
MFHKKNITAAMDKRKEEYPPSSRVLPDRRREARLHSKMGWLCYGSAGTDAPGRWIR